ncbi:hypothetical protein AGDE_09950 [Angomonas deanei]|uniref:RESC1/2 CYTH-like domain-containing protein n=1 Tax=Angomonas deanei TaxID=59799 RepID=A0A7G2CEQ0_9TRYP|nr:hypothetical protein AGDE_09950 [Angomonas deanei]CAD2218378.1 hypothetical protein, conserved [Angomonas deanei]|eukprot:EPY29449.1 hypothetical protein AGDE_09950 [Angomonas deanei]
MIPKAFQLLTDDSSVDATITRVNTTTFPGYPSSTECYTLSASNSSVSIQSRYSKVLQWCYLNMVNMQVDGELHVKLGKLLIHSSAVNTSPSSGKAEEVLSTYKIQQRLQLRNPYTWITCLPESSIPIAEEFFQQAEGFTLVHKTSPTLTFEGTIRKDAEVTLSFEADDKGQLIGLHHPWSSLQSSYVTKEAGPDIFLSLQTRPPVAKNELDRYNAQPLIELSQDDVSDVLPPALGQIIYLSENFTRRFEKVTEKGIVITVTEVRRQPLIVLHDEEEDPRVEYTLSIQIPGSVASRRGEPFDVRGICVELLHLSNRFQEAVRDSFIADFGCSVESNAAP